MEKVPVICGSTVTDQKNKKLGPVLSRHCFLPRSHGRQIETVMSWSCALAHRTQNSWQRYSALTLGEHCPNGTSTFAHHLVQERYRKKLNLPRTGSKSSINSYSEKSRGLKRKNQHTHTHTASKSLIVEVFHSATSNSFVCDLFSFQPIAHILFHI